MDELIKSLRLVTVYSSPVFTVDASKLLPLCETDEQREQVSKLIAERQAQIDRTNAENRAWDDWRDSLVK